tara:strand:- start:13900 stop:15102 length:1203 start_codon:yes stop_codon:yes gene_type:complete
MLVNLGIFYSILFKFFGPVVSLFTILWGAKYLGAEWVGQYSYFMQFSIFFMVLFTVGLERFIYSKSDQLEFSKALKVIIIPCFYRTFFIFIVASSVLMCTQFFFGVWENYTWVLYVIINSFFSFVLIFFVSLLFSIQRFSIAVFLQSCCIPLGVFLAVYFFSKNENFTVYLLVCCSTAIVSLISVVIFSLLYKKRVKFSSIHKMSFKEEIYSRFRYYKGQLYDTAATNYDILIAGLLLKPSELGVYAFSSRLAVAPIYLSQLIESFLMPKAKKQSFNYIDAIRVSKLLLIFLSISFFLWIFLGKLILSYVGHDFLQSYSIITILLLAHMCTLIVSPFNSLGMMQDKIAKYISSVSSFSLIAFIVLVPLAGLWLEGLGLALSVLFVNFFTRCTIFTKVFFR